MDQANANIVCIMFGAWIWKIRGTSQSLKGFGTIRQKIQHCYFLLHRFMFHNENLVGKRCSSPLSCCLQGIRFPGAESLPRLVQPPLSLYEVKPNPSPPCKRQQSSNSSTSYFTSPSPEPEDMEVEFPESRSWDPSTRPFRKLSSKSSSIGL